MLIWIISEQLWLIGDFLDLLQLVVALALVAVVYAGEETAQIISQESDISPEGLYQYAYETDNGIVVKEQGAQKDLGEEKSSVG